MLIPRIDFPELFFGFVAPIGADLDRVVAAFKSYFSHKPSETWKGGSHNTAPVTVKKRPAE